MAVLTQLLFLVGGRKEVEKWWKKGRQKCVSLVDGEKGEEGK